jgi:hypothetical protein
MAEIETAKAPLLYERGEGKSTAPVGAQRQ